MRYPGNYGFVPHTLSGDGDPVDVLVCNTRALVPGCVINVRPIGVLVMEDNAGQDEKIIAVPSPKLTLRYENVTEYTAPAGDHARSRSQHFFEHYKDLEPGKWVKIGGWHDAAHGQADDRRGRSSGQDRRNRSSWAPVPSLASRGTGSHLLARSLNSRCGELRHRLADDARSSAPQAKSRACSSAILRAVSLAFGLPVASTSPTAQPSLLGDLADLLDDQHLGLLFRISRIADEPAMDGGEGDRVGAILVSMRHSIFGPAELKAAKLSQAGAQIAAWRKAVEHRFPQIAGIDDHGIAAIAGADEIGPFAVAFLGGGEDRAVLVRIEVGVDAGNLPAA